MSFVFLAVVLQTPQDPQMRWICKASRSRTLMVTKFAVLHSTCMLRCQLVLYLLACRWKFGPLF